MTPFATWAEGLSTQTVGEDLCFWSASNFGPKTGLNLSEDFLFGLQLILDRKTGLILGGKFFILIFVILKSSTPPLFSKSCVRYWLRG